ncbi:MAG: NifU family protein [Terracidiphilus sp.]|jgi:Fe-S cluster biogenesis protein NfuA
MKERRHVADSDGFQEQVKRLSELIAQFDQMPACREKDSARELVQLLMEVHGKGLERMMEIVFESSESGSALIDRLASDEAAGGLLLLYSLHPDSLETRVQSALERIRPRLNKLACTVEPLSIGEGVVRLALKRNGHSCGSSAKELRSIVENGVYELAPDVTTLEILGLEEPASSGFVALESLLTGVHAAASAAD